MSATKKQQTVVASKAERDNLTGLSYPHLVIVKDANGRTVVSHVLTGGDGTFRGSQSERVKTSIDIDRADVLQYFVSEWDANYATWLAQSQTAQAGHEYEHGNFILTAARQVVEATKDHDPTTSARILDEACDLVQNWIAQAQESPVEPSTIPPDPADPNFPATYFGWTGLPPVGGVPANHASSLTEFQWAAGAVALYESIALGRTPASTPNRTSAQLQTETENTLDWIDHNIIDKWFDQAQLASQRFFGATKSAGAAADPPTDFWIDKIFLMANIAAALRSGMAVYSKVSIAFNNPTNNPDVWIDRFWDSRLVFVDGDGALLFDFDNPNNIDHSPLTGFYPNQDTIHAARLFACVANETLRNGFQNQPDYKVKALARTISQRIWNGETGDAIQCSSWITGERGHDYEGFSHAVTGVEGRGWVYNGGNMMALISDDVQEFCQHLLDFIRRHTPTALDAISGTGGRHTTAFARIGMAAGLLWSDYWRDQRDFPG